MSARLKIINPTGAYYTKLVRRSVIASVAASLPRYHRCLHPTNRTYEIGLTPDG